MSNLIRGEFYKLRKSKYFIAMILLSLVVAYRLIYRWDFMVICDRKPTNQLFGIYSILDAFDYIDGTACLIFAILAGEFIANDFKNNTLSKSFIYGYERSKVIISKLIVFVTFSLFLELIYTTIFVIYTSSKQGFCEVLDVNTVLYLIRILVVGTIYSISVICVIAMIAVITKNTLYTIGSTFIFFITMSLVEDLPGSRYQNLVPSTSWMPHVVTKNAMQICSLQSEIVTSIILSILISIIVIAGSLLYVNHKDIK
jgi:hypothetical protein